MKVDCIVQCVKCRRAKEFKFEAMNTGLTLRNTACQDGWTIFTWEMTKQEHFVCPECSKGLVELRDFQEAAISAYLGNHSIMLTIDKGVIMITADDKKFMDQNPTPSIFDGKPIC